MMRRGRDRFLPNDMGHIHPSNYSDKRVSSKESEMTNFKLAKKMRMLDIVVLLPAAMIPE